MRRTIGGLRSTRIILLSDDAPLRVTYRNLLLEAQVTDVVFCGATRDLLLIYKLGDMIVILQDGSVIDLDRDLSEINGYAIDPRPPLVIIAKSLSFGLVSVAARHDVASVVPIEIPSRLIYRRIGAALGAARRQKRMSATSLFKG